MPLRELATSVTSRAVSAEALVAESLGRIERLDGPINAVVRTRGDGAFADAAAVDARVEAGDDPGPLAGLPLLVKDNEDAAGLPTTFGSLLREHASPAVRDCEAVARLRAAGAVVVGKTNLPEFAFEGFTSNRLFGDTRDPWALDWSPGGSSGGSGAALAAGMAPLATGTDGGGSIRIPAAFCGLVGLKPTHGLVGHDPTPSWIDLSSKGPLAQSVADAALLLELMRGRSPATRRRCPRGQPRPDAWPERILATPRLVDYGPLPASIASLFDDALAALASATGLPIEPVDPPLSRADRTRTGSRSWAWRSSRWIGRDVAVERAGELTPYLRGALEAAATITLDQYLEARRRRFDDTRAIDELLGLDHGARLAHDVRGGVLRRRPACRAATRSGHPRPPTTRRPRTSPGTRRCRCRRARRRTACRSACRSPGRASPTTWCSRSVPRGRRRARGRWSPPGSRRSVSDRSGQGPRL